MATVVNNPAAGTSDSSHGMGFFLGMLVLLAVIVMLFYVGIPALRNATTAPTAPSVQVPDQIDVNVDTPQ